MSQTIFITLGVLAVISLGAGHNVQPIVEHNLIETILKSSRSLATGRSLDCFTTYLPLINAATAKYEAEYTACLQKTANSKQRVENEVAKDRSNVTESSENICNAYTSCTKLDSSLDYFECSNKVAGESISASYDIQTISKAKAQYILLRYETIMYDQNTCTDTCSDVYISETSKLYSQLEACLAGTELPPDTTTSPTTTTTSSVAGN